MPPALLPELGAPPGIQLVIPGCLGKLRHPSLRSLEGPSGQGWRWGWGTGPLNSGPADLFRVLLTVVLILITK